MSIRRLLDASFGLLRLGIATRFRLGSSYWRWRKQTAFGQNADAVLSRRERWRMMIDYAAWTTRMRRL